MKILKKNSGFTLIEILVVISVIIILFLAGSQLDFNRMWSQERIEIFNTKILSHYETIRNNALLGKWIDLAIDVPDKWKIRYSSVWDGGVASQYSINDGTSWVNYDEITPMIPDRHSITNLNCYDLNGNTAQNSGTNAEIIFDGNDITLWWKCSASARVLQFETNFLDITYQISVNMLNGTMDMKPL